VSIEARLAGLAAAAGPLRRVLAALAARLIEIGGYERLCYARLRDYARERLGLSARQVHELARVGRALVGLPRLERALAENDLPWSKLRLLVVVATAEDEDSWIALAHALPVRRLEAVVREHAKSRDEPSLAREPTTRVIVRCSPAVQEKWIFTREFAERVAGQWLSAADALEAITAEVFSTISVDPAFVDEPEPVVTGAFAEDDEPRDEPRPCPRSSAPELPRAIAALAEGLDEADAFEVDRRLRLAVHLEQTLDADIAPLLRAVTSAEYEWSGDYQPLASYAPESLGMSARKARALMRLERACEVCPELRAAYRRGRLSWVKAHGLLPLLLLDMDGEYRSIWTSWAERTTVRRLERDVERALLLRAGHDAAWFRCKFDPERAQDPIPPEERPMCAHEIDLEATQELVFRLPQGVAALFLGVRETVRYGLERVTGRAVFDGEVFDAILDGALLSWTLRDPGARHPDPVAEREGYRCAVPGCTSRCNHHDHHIVFRGRGGSDAFENRVLICAFHHQRCLHAGLMRIRGAAPDGLWFELGLRPTG
ncbi:MAG: HNH endonuclease signature motif containing protein, partial [Myxococcota bacterium]